MKKMKTIILAVFFASCALADQLQWNSPSVAAKAIQSIRPNSVLISYCSECDKVPLEIWRVIKVVMTPTTNDDYFKVTVFAKKLFVSQETFNGDTYKEPVNFVQAERNPNNTLYSDLYILQAIDLAYVYVPDEENAFVCLGKKLNLDCSVSVEKINLTDEMLKQLTARTIREDHRGNKSTIVIDHRGEIIDEM